ncbi:hypothetical protein B0T21DRAFT_151395 [Apiosordaria backusii]|uniref:Uncharacterized protein n=1 Tax=Apiosordaria backusii TaxID=314023 RepID=A0AA40EFR0_9PEZI|nr:hypothetical protein B0T21DRAFT_151395 [Apiosordaria backusii]
MNVAFIGVVILLSSPCLITLFLAPTVGESYLRYIFAITIQILLFLHTASTQQTHQLAFSTKHRVTLSNSDNRDKESHFIYKLKTPLFQRKTSAATMIPSRKGGGMRRK